MPKCKYHEVCGLDALEYEEKLCILHSRIPDKDNDVFKKAFEAHRNKKQCDFSWVFFPENADFSGITFAKEANFCHTEFFKEANFGNTIFEETANFSSATFTNGANFSSATFTKDANFSSVEFSGEESVKFNQVRFTGFANFVGAWFFTKDRVDFLKTAFTKRASFNSAMFGNAVYFYHTMFSEEVNFELSQFFGKVRFKGATFTNGGNFLGAAFSREVDFSETVFQGRTLFAPKQEENKTLRMFSASAIDFRRVIVEPLDVLTIRDADLKKCFLEGTDLRKVEITNADWPEIIWPKKMPKGFGWLRTKRIGVYDEASLPKGETRSLPHIERVYRELKQNYEDRRDFDRAGDFHYGEKQMRRKNPEIPLGRRFLLWLYWFVSGYGERCLRPVVWATVLLFTSALGYYRWGLQPKGSSSRLICSGFRDSAEYLFYSFRVMTFLKPEDLVPLGYARYVNAFESLVGPLLIGFFALALRQRLKR